MYDTGGKCVKTTDLESSLRMTTSNLGSVEAFRIPSIKSDICQCVFTWMDSMKFLFHFSTHCNMRSMKRSSAPPPQLSFHHLQAICAATSSSFNHITFAKCEIYIRKPEMGFCRVILLKRGTILGISLISLFYESHVCKLYMIKPYF